MTERDVLAGSGLNRSSLGDPEAPIPIRSLFVMWENLLRRVRDDALPIEVARSFTLRDYPVLGFAVMTAASGRQALSLVTRFSGIVSSAGRWSVEESPDIVSLRWHRPGPLTLGHRLANEATLAEMAHAARQVFGDHVPLLSTSFRHAAPASTAAHRAHFGGRIRWKSAAEELTFSRALLDMVPSAHNPALSAHFEREASRLHSIAGRDAPLAARVRTAIESALTSGEPGADRIASELGLSERSLRRGLAEQGSSFRAIVDSTRKQRADLLLLDRRASLAEVALLLGFSELSAFSRAFKRWTGRSPREARKDQLEAAQNV